MINGSSTIKLSVASLRLVSPGRQLTVSHLVFFLLKNWRPLLVFSSRLSPQTFFYLFDLVFPLFSVNSATFFSFGCSVFPWRVLPGAVPPVTPLNTISHLVKVTVGYIANTIEVGQMVSRQLSPDKSWSWNVTGGLPRVTSSRGDTRMKKCGWHNTRGVAEYSDFGPSKRYISETVQDRS